MGSTPSYPVGINTDQRPVTESNDRDLLLTVAMGEVQTAFEDSIAVADKVMMKTITSGDSARFIATGEMSARYHERGTEMQGQDFRAVERFIRLDRPMIADFSTYDFDTILQQFDLRGPMTQKAGYALSRQYDFNTLATLARAALVYTNRDTSGTGDAANKSLSVYAPLYSAWTEDQLNYGLQPDINQPGGTVLAGDFSNATQVTRALHMYNAILKASEVMDLKNVPKEGRYCVIPTNVFYDFVYARNSNNELFNFDANFMGPLTPGQQNSGVQSFNINGVNVFSTNRFSRTSQTISAGDKWPIPKYKNPWASIYGIVWQQEAVGNLLKMGVTFETQRDVRRQEDFNVAKMLGGHDVLRPDCAVLLWNASSSGTVAALDPYANQSLNSFVTDTSYSVATT